MQGLSTILFAVGSVIAFIGGILFLIAAFRESIIWGLLCLCFSPVSLVFLILHWQQAKKPFFVELVGFGLCMLAMLIAPDGGAQLRGYVPWFSG